MIFIRKFQIKYYRHGVLQAKSRCSWPLMAFSKGCELSWKSPLYISALATENNAEFMKKS